MRYTASAKFQSSEAGLVDETGTEEEILAKIRALICMLPCNNEEDVSYEECTDDLNRLCEGIENAAEDTAVALSSISDNGVFFEVKKDYAKDMVTGFIRLNGMTVGAVANRSKVYNEDAFNIPVLTLTNVTGFDASTCGEKKRWLHRQQNLSMLLLMRRCRK